MDGFRDLDLGSDGPPFKRRGIDFFGDGSMPSLVIQREVGNPELKNLMAEIASLKAEIASLKAENRKINQAGVRHFISSRVWNKFAEEISKLGGDFCANQFKIMGKTLLEIKVLRSKLALFKEILPSYVYDVIRKTIDGGNNEIENTANSTADKTGFVESLQSNIEERDGLMYIIDSFRQSIVRNFNNLLKKSPEGVGNENKLAYAVCSRNRSDLD